MCVLSNSIVSLTEKQRWIDSGTMIVALYCTNVSNRSVLILAIALFWVSQQNDKVRQSTFLEFAQHLACL